MDVKNNDEYGGTATSDTVHVRDLNTVNMDGSVSHNDDCDWLSLSANQMTLLYAGKYEIDVQSPACNVDANQAFLHDGTGYVLEGTSEMSQNAHQASDNSIIRGTLDISSSKTYEVRHWTQTGSTNNGLGYDAGAGANPHSKEIYTIVKITRIRTLRDVLGD